MSGLICNGGYVAAQEVEGIKIDAHAGIGINERCHAPVHLAISRSSALVLALGSACGAARLWSNF